MPGLLRGMARTAAIAGTATAVSNRVSKRQGERWVATGSAAAGTGARRCARARRALDARPAQGARRTQRPGGPHRGGVRRPEGQTARLGKASAEAVPPGEHLDVRSRTAPGRLSPVERWGVLDGSRVRPTGPEPPRGARLVARGSLGDAQVRRIARADRCIRGIRGLGFIAMAGRAARCDRAGDGLGDPGLPGLRPGRADRLHGFTLITLRYRVPPSIRPGPVAKGRMACRDGRGRRSKRGARHRTDARADRGPLLRRAAHGDARRQQLHRPHRRGRRGDSAAARAELRRMFERRRESGGR